LFAFAGLENKLRELTNIAEVENEEELEDQSMNAQINKEKS
jgi:hypothetical protein